MDTYVIEARGLRKEFVTRRGGRRVAVDNLDLSVPKGGVHGFLGPNGSGKTTTIRMLLGLASPTAGTMALMGREVPQHLPAVLDRVGAVVEAPKFAPNFTARTNLLLLAQTIGKGSAQVDAALETVGLAGREKDRFKTYSLGMKQRLAIAATLIKEPELLILDEPTNGLDPAGIREIRETIRGLGDSGVTVLLSSHILAEVQQVCDHATIIGNGRLLASGSVSELIGTSNVYLVRVGEVDQARSVLAARQLAAEPTADGALRVTTDEPPETITRELAQAGLYVSELTPQRRDLEAAFLALTEGEALGGSL